MVSLARETVKMVEGAFDTRFFYLGVGKLFSGWVDDEARRIRGFPDPDGPHWPVPRDV